MKTWCFDLMIYCTEAKQSHLQGNSIASEVLCGGEMGPHQSYWNMSSFLMGKR